jgi:CheY-like chemotaxis protein
VNRFAFAFEAFAADIAGMPDQASPSVLRTMSQAADFLGVLLEQEDRAALDAAGVGNILIVDDEPGALQLISVAMQFVGLASMSADTPSASLAAAQHTKFDLIFLDVGLPEMSGFDLCAQLRATPGHDRVPIVFITGMATFQNRAKSSLSGGNDFIGKPFHMLELGVKALTWLLRGRLGLL